MNKTKTIAAQQELQGLHLTVRDLDGELIFRKKKTPSYCRKKISHSFY